MTPAQSRKRVNVTLDPVVLAEIEVEVKRLGFGFTRGHLLDYAWSLAAEKIRAQEAEPQAPSVPTFKATP